MFTFDPEEIIHPKSTDWVPPDQVADYFVNRLRKSFDKEVRNRLRSECPRPVLKNKIADTPEVDPSMITYMGEYARDPKKGLDRPLKACQDKLLDILGPLAKTLEMGFHAKDSGVLIDPDILIGWT